MTDIWNYDEQETRLGDPFIADKYHFTQARTIWALGFSEVKTVHDAFARRTPFGSYLLVNGIERVIKHLHNFKFTAEDIEAVGLMDPPSLETKYDGYLDYLAKLRFKGDVWAIPEGELAYVEEPILRVEGNWLETWMVESAILKATDDASLIATYASRAKVAAGNVPVLDFGLRRSKGDGANVSSARAAYIGGLDATSNGRAAVNLKIPWAGTTSHEGIMGLTAQLRTEVDAFVAMMMHNKENDVLIADTFGTIAGIENIKRAVKIVGRPAKGARTDSGDTIGYTFEMRKRDPNREAYQEIMPSGDYTFELIYEAMQRKAPATGFAVGGKMVAPSDPTTAGLVYKLVMMDMGGEMVPVIKISDDEIKTLLPGKKIVYRNIDEGKNVGDIIALNEEEIPEGNFKPVLVQAMKGGKTRRSKITYKERSLAEIREFAFDSVAMLPEEVRRIEKPEKYQVNVSDKLRTLQRQMIKRVKAENARMNDVVTLDRGVVKTNK